MKTKEILELVKNGSMSVEEAEGHFRRQPFEDMGYAKLDLHRRIRSGFPEVIFCSGKPDEFLINIFRRMAEKEGQAFGTRATAEQYEMVRKVIPDIQYDPVSRILKLERTPAERKGLIAVVTGGTADIPVAEEAAQTAEYFGSKVERIYDVGVSGIHRLLSQTQKLQEANCIVAVAGMEGALASVVGGLVSNPVIAVPTSVGYGASGADFRWIRSEFRRFVSAADNDQLLRERNRGSKYRQRLRSGLYGDTDQPPGLWRK